MGGTFSGFDDAYVVNVAIAVEIEVGDTVVRVVEFLFKLLEVLSLGKNSSHCLEVKVLRYVTVGCGNSYRFVCTCYRKHHQKQTHHEGSHTCFHNL